jgi:hypothetical protein
MSETTAGEMLAGQVYKSCDSELSYFVKQVEKTTDKVKLSVFIPKSKKWKELEVPHEYKVRDLTDDEKTAYAVIESGKAVRKAKTPKDPNAPAKLKLKGAVSGLGMLAAYGKHIKDNIDTVGGRSKAIAAMIADCR